MILSLKLVEKPVNSLIYMERYVCTKKYHALADYSEVSIPYTPQIISDGFNLPLIKAQTNLYGNISLIPDILKQCFPMHPDTADDCRVEKRKIVQYIKVLPTASMRTVLAEIEGQQFFLKLSIDRHIARATRKLSSKQIKHGLSVVKDIEQTSLKNPPQLEKFAFLPDIAGITAVINNDEVGTVIRKLYPCPDRKEKDGCGYIPIFSLYSIDRNNPSDKALLVQLIEKNHADALEFTLTQIVKPVIQHFDYFASERGLLLQAHAQNTLLEVDSDFEIKRIVYRDFGSITIDGEVRKEKNLFPFEDYLIDNGKDRVASPIEYSLGYDEFMAAHSFDLLGKVLEENFKLDIDIFKKRIKKIFSDTMACKRKFPKVQYSIPVKLSTGRYDPFILKENPDYR